MRRSRKHMLEGQINKPVKTFSNRVSFRVPSLIYDYVQGNVIHSKMSRNRWLSSAVVEFGKRITEPESPAPLTEEQINKAVYDLIEGTRISFCIQLDASISLRLTESAQHTANNIVQRFSTQLIEGADLPKNIKSKLMLIVLFDHYLRQNNSVDAISIA